jgi:putative tryptophan/tyrosine transport system substrate-binding protein
MKIHRRIFSLAAGILLAAPSGSFGQPQGTTKHIGILVARARANPPGSDYLVQVSAFLAELGYVEGKNLVIEWRFAGGDYERLKTLAMDLARLPVDVILSADGTPPALAAKEATKTTPIVFMNVGDPVAVGLVQSLAHPGGNVTGLALIGHDIIAKQMEMLGSVVPGLVRVAVLTNPANPQSPLIMKRLQDAALQTGREILAVEAQNPAGIANAFAVIRRERPGALVVTPESFFFQQRARIAQEAASLRLPSMGGHREYAEAGGLMGYGPNRIETLRRAASYVDRILRGANPADLPVEMPTKFELVINRRTARRLGLEIPPELLVLADKVIE